MCCLHIQTIVEVFDTFGHWLEEFFAHLEILFINPLKTNLVLCPDWILWVAGFPRIQKGSGVPGKIDTSEVLRLLLRVKP